MKYWEIIADNLSKAHWSWGCGILLLLLTQLTGHAQNEFTWKDASDNTHNLFDLQEILRKHQQWIESEGKSGTQANLSNADLTDANLVRANLTKAKLTNANLTNVKLHGTNLTDANLTDANLTKANLTGTNLTNANLTNAELTKAELLGTNLSNANLTKAKLTNAWLLGTNLTNAWVYEGTFGGALFEPTSLLQLRGMSHVQNLELLTYNDNPVALVQLRKQFEDGGLREQERKITYALKRREAELSWEGTVEETSQRR